jgi:hypothetical protein
VGLDCGEVVGGGRLDEDIALGVGEEGLGVREVGGEGLGGLCDLMRCLR